MTTQTTIKQHLTQIRAALDAVSETDQAWHEFSAAYKSITAIEAALDAPMKSAEAWYDEQLNTHLEDRLTADDAFDFTDIIRAIQADAIASKLPEVDLRGLADSVLTKLIRSSWVVEYRGSSNAEAEDIIHAVLLKARGGV